MTKSEQFEHLLASAIVAGPVDDDSIRVAEKVLGVSFPPSCRVFLSKYGAAMGDGFRLAGLFEHINDDEPPQWMNVVTETLGDRDIHLGHIPNGYVYITDDGTDFTFYLNTKRENPNDECPVVVLGPGAHNVIVAEDFVDFLIRLSANRLEY